MKKKSWEDRLLMVWDILFVLILCFIVLLTTMLLTKGNSSEAFTGYSLNPLLLLGLIAALGGYLFFMLHMSLKSLRELITRFFEQNKDEKEKEEA